MYQLEGQNLGKRFHRQWIFRQVNFSLQSGDRLLLTGSNGSGKSTLLRILAGQLTPTEGQLRHFNGKRRLDPELWYRHLSWSGPYMDLYPELTLLETIRLHQRFRPAYASPDEVIEHLQLGPHRDKELRNFSSGMLHRVKVGLALFSQSKVLILDEATTNMDRQNGDLIWDLTRRFQEDRLLIWASNKDDEFDWFEMVLELN